MRPLLRKKATRTVEAIAVEYATACAEHARLDHLTMGALSRKRALERELAEAAKK